MILGVLGIRSARFVLRRCAVDFNQWIYLQLVYIATPNNSKSFEKSKVSNSDAHSKNDRIATAHLHCDDRGAISSHTR